MPDQTESDTGLQLLAEHGDFLYRYALSKVRDSEISEEVVQNTLLNAIKALPNFQGKSSIRTWLVQILRNEISNHFRKLNRESEFNKKVEATTGSDLGPLLNPQIANQKFASAIEKEEFWAMIQNCFTRVPEHLLETFLAKWNGGDKKTEDLCNELGISPSNYSVRMFRTRLLLRKCIESTWLQDE